jgi:hypothetical protein
MLLLFLNYIFIKGWLKYIYRSMTKGALGLVILPLNFYWYLNMQWSPRDALPAPISSAIYSCDGLLVYATFCDGAVGVFEAESLRLRCRIGPSSYIPPSIVPPYVYQLHYFIQAVLSTNVSASYQCSGCCFSLDPSYPTVLDVFTHWWLLLIPWSLTRLHSAWATVESMWLSH